MLTRRSRNWTEKNSVRLPLFLGLKARARVLWRSLSTRTMSLTAWLTSLAEHWNIYSQYSAVQYSTVQCITVQYSSLTAWLTSLAEHWAGNNIMFNILEHLHPSTHFSLL